MIWFLSGVAIPTLAAIWLWCIDLKEEAVAIVVILASITSIALALYGGAQMGFAT